ncbi:MAG: toll/interleukin-1 receptor domain-containing protein, partial [Ruminococcus sp.]|nr:toll/interleukin-1 receptor domain-containing protein [Ruminococcus sp.]
MTDINYKFALQYADEQQKALYEQEAATIKDIQYNYLSICQNEKPYDIFICYKESDENGNRTVDSCIAEQLYDMLTNCGYKVFFARITLEDKLGTAYEPYIFAALNSAKIMLAVGTKREHYDAVWVKNEWSRYINLVKNSKGTKTLIPVYKDMNPYELPEEFMPLQAQDMSKIGSDQDLIRGIKKILPLDENSYTSQQAEPAPV